MFLMPVRKSYNYQIDMTMLPKKNSLFSNNSLVFYKSNSTASNKSGTVVNSRAVSRRT